MPEANRLDELNELSVWNSPLVMQHADPRMLGDIASAATARDVRFKDKSVDHTYGTDQSSLPPLGDHLQTFGQWPSVAGTIWNKLLQMTGFDPSNVDYNSSVFAAFKTKFSTAPYWNGIEFNIQYRDATLHAHDYRAMVNAVIDLISVGATANVITGVISSIRKIAQLASQQVRTDVKDTLAQNTTLCIHNGKLYVFFLYGTITMNARQGKYTVLDQAMRVVRGYGVLDFDFCKRHAENILRYDKKSLEEWEGMAAAHDQPENTSDGWPPDVG